MAALSLQCSRKPAPAVQLACNSARRPSCNRGRFAVYRAAAADAQVAEAPKTENKVRPTARNLVPNHENEVLHFPRILLALALVCTLQYCIRNGELRRLQQPHQQDTGHVPVYGHRIRRFVILCVLGAQTLRSSQEPCGAVSWLRAARTPQHSCPPPRRRRSTCRATVAPRASQLTAAARRVQRWFACVANAQFMLNDVQNESFAEQLREKTRYYREKGWELDFFLVCEPEWLDKQHPAEAKKVQRPCVAVIGAEESWIRCAPPHAAGAQHARLRAAVLMWTHNITTAWQQSRAPACMHACMHACMRACKRAVGGRHAVLRS
jgi:Protein of unknown function (DUF2488)